MAPRSRRKLPRYVEPGPDTLQLESSLARHFPGDSAMRRAWHIILNLVIISGCFPEEHREQVPKVTGEEYDEVRSQLFRIADPEDIPPYEVDEAKRFLQSDRAKDIISRRLRMIYSDRGIGLLR